MKSDIFFSLDDLYEAPPSPSLSTEIKSQIDIFTEGMRNECNVQIQTSKLGPLRYQIEPCRRLLFKVVRKRNQKTGEVKVESQNLGFLQAQFKLMKQKKTIKDIETELKEMINFEGFQEQPLLPEPIDPDQRNFKKPIPPEFMRIVAPGLTASAEEQMFSIIENPFFGSLTPEKFTKGRDTYSHKYVIKAKK